MGKVISLHQLQQERENWRSENKTVVFTNGCFDLLHPGHTRYMQMARDLGDVLIVALNSDRAVKILKGESRPILKENERAEVMAALACVDYVMIFDDISPRETIAELLPDILVKGGDWGVDAIIGREEVEAARGKVMSLPFVEGVSTTEIIERITNDEKKNAAIKSKREVELYESLGLGLIFHCESGVIFTSQVGGYSCWQLAEEGIYIPLDDEVQKLDKKLHDHFTGSKWKGWCCHGIDEETADFIDDLLQSSILTKMLTVDRTRLDQSMEAMIYVKVDDQPATKPTRQEGNYADQRAAIEAKYKHLALDPFLYPFYGFGIGMGTLTWCNSD